MIVRTIRAIIPTLFSLQIHGTHHSPRSRSSVPRVFRTTEALGAADVVITMGCGDSCPILPGTRYEDWPLEDPAGKTLDTVRRIRDEIKDRVEQLLRDLATHS